MQIYTFEHYRPAYPQQGDHVVVHRGPFDANRDSFGPSMIRARDFYAVDDVEACESLSRGSCGFWNHK